MRWQYPLLGVGLVLCLAAGCGEKAVDADGSTRVGKCSVRFPAAPQSEETLMPGLGIKSPGFKLKLKEGVLLASSAEVPADAALRQDPEKELELIVTDNAQLNQAKLLGQEKLTQDGYTGREYRMEKAGGKNVVRTRVYYGDQRLYALTASGTKEFIVSPEAEGFFKSFKVVK